MLVPFAIDSNGALPDPKWSILDTKIYYESLLEIWERMGILYFNGPTYDSSNIKKSIDLLPVKIRPRVQALVSRVPIVPFAREWDGLITPKSLALLSEELEVAFVDDAYAEVDFGVHEDETSIIVKQCRNIEVCRLKAAARSIKFLAAKDSINAYIHKGEPYSKLWDIRFKSLARAPIKQVVILDRYAISQHIVLGQQTYLSGLSRFMRLLDTDASGPRHLRIYSAWTTDLNDRATKMNDIEADLRDLMSHLPKRSIARLQVYMLPNHVFRDDAHDRAIRFGDYAWAIGSGIHVFEGPSSPERSQTSFWAGGTIVTDHKRIEQDLASHPDVQISGVIT